MRIPTSKPKLAAIIAMTTIVIAPSLFIAGGNELQPTTKANQTFFEGLLVKTSDFQTSSNLARFFNLQRRRFILYETQIVFGVNYRGLYQTGEGQFSCFVVYKPIGKPPQLSVYGSGAQRAQVKKHCNM